MHPAADPSRAQARILRHVLWASALGALFEFYDFYLYGSLAALLAKEFFSGLNQTSAFILTLLAFASGFLVRPFGSLLFGRLGDRLGRKHTFLVTLILMGVSTFCVGCLPTYATAGMAAPIALVALRLLQGLALGGEYGGAATYVAEHVPAQRRASATSWIQMTGSLGLLLSLAVILLCRSLTGAAFDSWGWRIPFLVSALLLAISLYIRLKLRESPVFEQMKGAGTLSRAPLREAFANWGNLKRVLGALFGVTIGQAMVTYTCELYALYFLTISLKIAAMTANLLLAIALALGTPVSLLAGYAADRIGRKPVVLGGCLIAALSFVPLFHLLAHFGNPALENAVARAPVQVRADAARCHWQFDPLGRNSFRTSCDVAKSLLVKAGVPYANEAGPPGAAAVVRIGAVPIVSFEGEGLSLAKFERAQRSFEQRAGAALAAAGYRMHADEREINRPGLLAVLTVLIAYVSLVYGPLAAWLTEMFPPRIRYSAISLPYHIGFGWFGGLLPAIAFALVARSGDVFGGLWYPVLAALMSVTLGFLLVPETLRRGAEASAARER